ncbi:MAG TPA: DUF2203 domain-containing protein [Candidatus Binatia bacterium]|nr:DUF2203 domain-containing protein [Candidatus Binatia bacterium]
MSERSFSPEEVDRLIPVLTELMESVLAAHREATAVRERLKAAQERVALSGGALIDRRAWQADRARLEALSARVAAGAEEIGRLGGVIKDLELGLVDFPHRREGRLVNLCWKYGERAVRWWHGLDEGYAARKPL